MIMVDPGQETGINDVLAPWHVRIDNNLVIDARSGLSGDPLTSVIDHYGFSQIVLIPAVIIITGIVVWLKRR